MISYLSPARIIGLFTTTLIVVATASSYIAITSPQIYLNENQILYLFSTSAQVIAGIYGLTLTGFVFFRNELSREEFEDETLVDAVESLKKRYFMLLIFITAISILTLLLSNLAISHEGSGNSHLNTIIVNMGQSAFVTNLFVIAYFIFDVISPKRIEAASRKLQEKVDPSGLQEKKGVLEDFLKNYNQIEEILSKFGQGYQKVGSISSADRPQRHISNARLAEILFHNGWIDKSLFSEIKGLITLRNSIIHGADPVVSAIMVEASNKVLEKLKIALERGVVVG